MCYVIVSMASDGDEKSSRQLIDRELEGDTPPVQ